jgi:hypothetical protein
MPDLCPISHEDLPDENGSSSQDIGKAMCLHYVVVPLVVHSNNCLKEAGEIIKNESGEKLRTFLSFG